MAILGTFFFLSDKKVKGNVMLDKFLMGIAPDSWCTATSIQSLHFYKWLQILN